MGRFFNIPRGKYLLAWPPVIAVFAVIAVLLSISAARIVLRYAEIRRERAALEKKVEELKAEKERLEASVRAAGDPEVIERMAKERLNLKKPEEQVAIIVPLPKATSSGGEPPARRSGYVFRLLRGLLDFLKR